MKFQQDLVAMGEEAKKELACLLEKHPELRKMQEEIDERLIAAGSPENRLNVLGIMMESKLKELQEHLLDLASIVRERRSDF